MKPKLLLFVFVAGSALAFQNVRAERPQQQNQDEPPITLVKVKRTAPIKRPKAPDRQVVMCAYDGEKMQLTFLMPEGVSTLSVTDETLITATN